jgi:MFS superfamily sulfate permease-like transporter
LIQLAAGLLRLGQWFRAISPAVIQGMLAGIGVLIFASQVHVVVDDAPRGSGLKNLLSIPESLWKGIMPVDGSSHHLAAGIGLLTIGIMVAWSFVPKRLKMVPAPLVAVAIATLIAFGLGLPIKYVSVPSNLLSVFTFPSTETLGALLQPSVLGSALAIAIIASAETLLSATAVDRMHNGPRTQYNRELFAQGVGNAICGVLGALPMTGVIVRSSANVEAGAKTRLSAMLHGVWILACVALLPFVLAKIPTASLAAILVYTGIKLVSPKAIRELAKFGKAEVAIYVATVVAIVATNLLEGVLIGLGLSLLKLVWNFSHLEIRLRKESADEVTTLVLRGSATFIRLPKLAAALESIPQNEDLHVEISGLLHIDHACLDLLANQKKQRGENGGQLLIEWNQLYSKYHKSISESMAAPTQTFKGPLGVEG